MKPKSLFAILPKAQNERPSTRLRGLMVIVSFALAILFLYLVLRNLDWQTFFITLKNARYVYLPIGIFWASASYFIRALRLRVLLSSERSVSILNAFWSNMAGYLGNNFLPARAGELVRVGYIAKKNNISASYVLAVGLVERLMDLLALIVLGSLALSATAVVPLAFQNALKGISVLGLTGLCTVLALPYLEQPFGNLILNFPVLKEVYKIKLSDFLHQFIEGLKSLYSFNRIIQFASLTGLIWLMDAAGSVLLAYILKIQLSLQQAFILLAALGLSSAIPSTPGYIGVYQFVAVTTLSPFGISREDALVYILISQMLGYIVVGFWGIISLWQLNKNDHI